MPGPRARDRRAGGARRGSSRGLLVETLPDDWRALTAELGCVALHANHREFDAARVAEIRAAGLRMLAYTANEPARARELIGWGVDLIGPDFA